MVQYQLAKPLLFLLILSGCRNSHLPREASEREGEAILYKVKNYLQREKTSYPGNDRPIFEKVEIVRCDLKTPLQKKLIFFDGLEKGFVDSLKGKKGEFYFVGFPTSSHQGIIVAVEPGEITPIASGFYFIDE